MGIALSTVDGLSVGRATWEDYDFHSFVYWTAETQPDQVMLTTRFENGKDVRQKIAFLKEHRFNTFDSEKNGERWRVKAAPDQVLAVPARLSFDKVSVNQSAGLITISGFALDNKADEPVGGVLLEIDGRVYQAYYGLRRDEIARSLKSSVAANSGFRRDLSTTQLGPGNHTLRVFILTTDGSACYQVVGPLVLSLDQSKSAP